MAIYRIKIVGVHYAVNPDSTSSPEETELMHRRTAQRLSELDKQRPSVVLIPEPLNPVDARAVMARVMGERIGYVNKEQLDTVHALLETNGGRPLRATIHEVEARKHGWLFVALETPGEMPVEPLQKPEDAWSGWTSTLPVIAPDEAYFVREEAEVMLEDAFAAQDAAPHSTQSSTDDNLPSDGKKEKLGETPCPSVVNMDLMESYMNLWLRSALHDLSNEARLTREHYIMRLKQLAPRYIAPTTEPSSQDATPVSRIKALVTELEKQRTAICGQKRSNLRVDKWWKELVQSESMQHLWKTWMSRIDGNLEQGVNELDIPLKALPCDLYAYIDDRRLFFSRLHYSHVPRNKYWQIVSLMLLRDCARMESKKREEGGNETEHPHQEEGGCPETGHRHPEKTENEPFIVTVPKEMQTPEARKILTKLQKKGILDDDLQPVGLSAAKKGVLAWELCDYLGIKTCWKTMGMLWKCNGETIRKARDKGVMTDAVNEFTKKLKVVIRC